MSVILVAGPPGSGAGALAMALATAMPDDRVVQWPGTAPCDADAVVFVASAVAPMVPSQAALLGSVLAATGPVPVVAAVSKIDVNPGWPTVLEANRAQLNVPWVGVTADPDIGRPRLGDLLAALHTRSRPARASGGGRLIARRAQLAQIRLRTASRIRIDFAELCRVLNRRTGELTGRGLETFAEYATQRIDETVGSWEHTISSELEAVLRDCGIDPAELPAVAPVTVPVTRPERPDRTEARLTVLVGAVFGAGTGITVVRCLGDLAPGWSPWAGVLTGLAVGIWVIRSRRLLARRGTLHRWTAELLTAARLVLEERLATGALEVEVAIGLAGPTTVSGEKRPGRRVNLHQDPFQGGRYE